MSHFYVELDSKDIYWRSLPGRMVFLLIKKNISATNSNIFFQQAWDQWRWQIEACLSVLLDVPLSNDLFRKDFKLSIMKSIDQLKIFGDWIPIDFLNKLDDTWDLRFAKNYKSSEIIQLLNELLSLIE